MADRLLRAVLIVSVAGSIFFVLVYCYHAFILGR